VRQTNLHLLSATAHANDAEPRVEQCRAAVARAVAVHKDSFVTSLVELSIQEIAPLHSHDGLLLGLLEASIEENVVTGLHVLEHRIDPKTLNAPAAAVLYAQRLAQRDVPLSALLRAYRLGQESFVNVCLEEAVAQAQDEGLLGATMISLVNLVGAYVDHVCEEVAVAYEEERERWISRRGAVRARLVHDLLHDPHVNVREAESGLGYTLSRTHVAVDAWTEGPLRPFDEPLVLERLAGKLMVAVDTVGPPLVFTPDEGEAWIWLPVRSDTILDPIRVEEALHAADLPVRLAVGAPGRGLAGFRRSLKQAEQAKSVALLAGERRDAVTSFAAVGPVALMCADVDGLRTWVAEVLGPLAIDGEREAWLRETLRVFLQTNCSYAMTAETLFVHRNTVQYRVQQAQELRGRPVGGDGLEVQLALRVCKLLGGSVLAPPSA
jgi:hypothetical protein